MSLDAAFAGDQIRKIHHEVGDLLHTHRQQRVRSGEPAMSDLDEQQFAHTLIARVLSEQASLHVTRGLTPLDPDVEAEIAEAVHARMFGAGRLQWLLNDQSIENIDINGCDEVWVTRAGSSHQERVDAVASTDEELIELVQTLAAATGLNARPFDTANPELDLKLHDGSRLSAVMGVSTRPSVSIRRHRYNKVTLGDLIGKGTLTTENAAFLAAIIASRANVMIAGATAAGKTTLLRAMAGEIPSMERIITIENSLELALRNDERHPNCVELEVRLPNSEGLGAIGMSRLVRRTLRQNPDRVIVGEVLGDEVIDMLNAMSQGNDGSISTIHARSARGVFDRIATYAIMASERLPHEATHQLIAGGLDYVVYIARDPRTGRRYLDSILEVNGFDGTVQSSMIFDSHNKQSATWTGVMPGRREALTAAGWTPPVSRWDA